MCLCMSRHVQEPASKPEKGKGLASPSQPKPSSFHILYAPSLVFKVGRG